MPQAPRRLYVEAVEAKSHYGHAAHWISVGAAEGVARVAAFHIAAEVYVEIKAAGLSTAVTEDHGSVTTEEAGDNEGPRVLAILQTVAARWNGRIVP